MAVRQCGIHVNWTWVRWCLHRTPKGRDTGGARHASLKHRNARAPTQRRKRDLVVRWGWLFANPAACGPARIWATYTACNGRPSSCRIALAMPCRTAISTYPQAAFAHAFTSLRLFCHMACIWKLHWEGTHVLTCISHDQQWEWEWGWMALI